MQRKTFTRNTTMFEKLQEVGSAFYNYSLHFSIYWQWTEWKVSLPGCIPSRWEYFCTKDEMNNVCRMNKKAKQLRMCCRQSVTKFIQFLWTQHGSELKIFLRESGDFSTLFSNNCCSDTATNWHFFYKRRNILMFFVQCWFYKKAPMN